MADPTNIGIGPRLTSPLTNQTLNATAKGGAIGAVVPFVINVGTIGAVTDSVVARFKAPANLRVLSVNGGNRAIVGTCSFKVYNATDAVDVIGSTSLTTNTAITEVTSITNSTIDKGDEVQVLATAGTSITDLTVVITAVVTGEPANVTLATT